MKKRLFTCVALLLAAVMLLSACGSEAEQQQGQQEQNDGQVLKITLADPGTTGSFANDQVLYYADKVAELSGGSMEIEVFSDSLLGTETAMATNIQSGGLDMGTFYSTFSSMVTKAGIFDLPYLITERSEINKLKDSGILDEIYEEAETIGIKVVCLGENGFRHITNNTRPIVEPADLKGIVLRTPSNTLRVTMFERLGASPVAMAWSEVYQALESGVCDGQENPFSQIGGAQLYNVQKYLSLSSHIYTPQFICINLDLYNSLTEEQQQVLLDAGDLTTEYAWEAGEEYDEEQLKICEENGMEVNEVDIDAFREALLPLWDEFADTVGGSDFVSRAKEALGY